MQSISTAGMDELNDRLDRALKENPDKRRELHERIAAMLEQKVGEAIWAGGFADGGGRLRAWQESHVGSRGGYAAIRAVKGEVGADSPGAITNYNENGHRIRTPSGRSKRYQAHIRTPYVGGRHFYQSAGQVAEAEAYRMVDDFVSKLAESLG